MGQVCDGDAMTRAELMVEAQYIARVTCRQIELVLIEVEALDRAGRRIMLVDWMTGEIEHRDKRMD
jgi:hypothetical protein